MRMIVAHNMKINVPQTSDDVFTYVSLARKLITYFTTMHFNDFSSARFKYIYYDC